MINQFLSFFLQKNCPLCQRPSPQIICNYCEQKIKSEQRDLKECIIKIKDYQIIIWGKYDGYLKRAITDLKYNNKPELAKLLGTYLGKLWLNFYKNKLIEKYTVVPIPLHPKKIKIRGFNQAELIADGFCEITGFPHLPHLLSRVKNTEAMFSLTPSQRQANIHQAFTIGKDYHRFNRLSEVIIIDDIYTTGTTVEEAIKVLHTLQIKVQGLGALASSR
ncbi:MAG: ComF family protein [Cyanobacterium sp. T60_A2020_053]|nr:ComF family protein [Cyanobacterium sp. T60_A2020_053]